MRYAKAMSASISAVLIIKNEAPFIERALHSLMWCDEIVVVDAYSDDATPQLCQNPAAPWANKIKFIEKEWLGFSTQRNFAMVQTKNDWVFFLDGDEACSPELASTIRILIDDPKSHNLQFKIRRQEFFLRKPIHFGIWNPSYHIRLFKKTGVEFVGNVHEGVQSTYETKNVDAPIIHVEDLRIERFLAKLNHYTTLQAQNDFEKGTRTSFARIFLSFPAMFYKNYVYYKAYRDGREGFIISALEGISRTVRHLKIWQLQHLNRAKAESNAVEYKADSLKQ
jgi:glycosyltransferase involved in cell wall biosynthesis